jgi:hypothetical protein
MQLRTGRWRWHNHNHPHAGEVALSALRSDVQSSGWRRSSVVRQHLWSDVHAWACRSRHIQLIHVTHVIHAARVTVPPEAAVLCAHAQVPSHQGSSLPLSPPSAPISSSLPPASLSARPLLAAGVAPASRAPPKPKRRLPSSASSGALCASQPDEHSSSQMRTERSGSSRKNARACKGEGGAHSVQPRLGACLCMYGMRACVRASE